MYQPPRKYTDAWINDNKSKQPDIDYLNVKIDQEIDDTDYIRGEVGAWLWEVKIGRQTFHQRGK